MYRALTNIADATLVFCPEEPDEEKLAAHKALPLFRQALDIARNLDDEHDREVDDAALVPPNYSYSNESLRHHPILNSFCPFFQEQISSAQH